MADKVLANPTIDVKNKRVTMERIGSLKHQCGDLCMKSWEWDKVLK